MQIILDQPSHFYIKSIFHEPEVRWTKGETIDTHVYIQTGLRLLTTSAKTIVIVSTYF